MKVDSGDDLQAEVMGGHLAGATGTTTSAPTATTVTDSGASFPASNGYAGHIVVMSGVYGVIVSNTSTALAIDRWYTPGSPGGAAAATPGSGNYVVLPGGAPAWYIALTANSTAPAAGDTTLASEITTAGGGLVRKLATYAHTAGASSYTLFETLVSPTATLSASGDQLTITQTVST